LGRDCIEAISSLPGLGVFFHGCEAFLLTIINLFTAVFSRKYGLHLQPIRFIGCIHH
jgi:hypothetical protein